MSNYLIVITIITTKLLGIINKYLKKQNNMSIISASIHCDEIVKQH